MITITEIHRETIKQGDVLIEELFKRIQTKFGASGDISPECTIELEEATDRLQSIVTEQVFNNLQKEDLLIREKAMVMTDFIKLFTDSMEDDNLLTSEVLDKVIKQAKDLKESDF